MHGEIIKNELTQNVLDTQLFMRLRLTGIEALRRYGITGAGMKIAVVDYPGSFTSSIKTPHYLPYKATKMKDFLALGIRQTPAVLKFYQSDFHGIGIGGLISYLLPEAQVRFYDASSKRWVEIFTQIIKNRPDIVNLSLILPTETDGIINKVIGAGITVVSAAAYNNSELSLRHNSCPQDISVGFFFWDRYGELRPYAAPGWERVDVYVPAWNLPVPSGGNTFTNMSGTSLAAPIVSVAAAVARSRGSRSPEADRDLILQTAIHWRGVKVPHFGNLIKALN